jgi:hypothetical protein
MLLGLWCSLMSVKWGCILHIVSKTGDRRCCPYVLKNPSVWALCGLLLHAWTMSTAS